MEPPTCKSISSSTRVKCSCTGKEKDSYETEEIVTCPEEIDGCPGWTDTCIVWLGTRYVTEYTSCDDDDPSWRGDEPEFYKEKCCKNPPFALPECSHVYSVYRGGAEIKGGVDRYKAKYGDNVQLVAVSPEDGICGKHTIEQVVTAKSCCDGIDPVKLEFVSRTPNNITLRIVHGNQPYKLTTTGPETHFANGERVLRDFSGGEFSVAINDEQVCYGDFTVKVTDDGCGSDRISG